MSPLIARLAARAAACPDAVALATDDDRITIADLLARVDAEAARIRAVDPGVTPIGIDLANGVDWVVADLAVSRLGRAGVPLPPFFSSDQAALALADAGASAVIRPHGIDRLPCLPAVLPAGTARISYTSGSTGTPKGICLSERQLLATADAVIGRLGAGMARRHLPVLPLGVLLENVAGLYASLLAGGAYLAQSGAAIGLANPFAPDFAALAGAIDRHKATSLILVPELLHGLVAWLEADRASLPSLTLVAVGGARVPVALLDRAARVGLPVLQGYGLTECGSVVAIERADEDVRGSVGRPLDHVSVGIADDGEIVIDGDLYLGLVGRPREPGPLMTGDLGSVDAEGRLFVSGRKSNLVITGFGRNISPEWIEGELLAQAEIAQAMVFGDGEADLSALIVPRSATTDPSDAVARVNAGLPPYARIGHWELSRPFLPHDGTMTGNGRLRRAAILARRDSLPFFDQLVMRTAAARGRLLSVPQLRAGLRGEIRLATYIAYLTQAYHHVCHTVPLMQAARAGLADRPELIAALDEYIAEETGHEHWILDDIAAAGGDPVQALRQGPSAATRAMVDHAYRTIRSGRPVAFFGMVFVLEGTSIALATQGADAVRASLGLPKSAFRYLTSHGALDQDHMKFFEALVNRLDDPADRDAILTMANEIFALFAGIFADIPMEHDREYA